MPISVACPGCGKAYQVADKLAGTRAKCQCGGVLTIPGPQSQPLQPDDNRLRVTCGGCQTQHVVPMSMAGKAARCTSCGAIVNVPELANQSPAATPDPLDNDWMADPLSGAAGMSGGAQPAPAAFPRGASLPKGKRKSVPMSLPFSTNGKVITVVACIGIMLVLSLAVMLSGMPLWLKGRVVFGVAMLMQIFPVAGLALSGKADWAKAVAASMAPFAVIGFAVLAYGIYQQEAVPVGAEAAMSAGAPTDAYQESRPKKLEFSKPTAILEWNSVHVKNWKDSRHPPRFQFRLPDGTHAQKSLPCFLVALHQYDLLTREKLPQGRGSGPPIAIGADIAGNAVMIQYWLSGKAYDWRKDGVDKGDLKQAITEFRQAQGGLLNAKLAVDLALSLPEVDPNRIYAIGSRESGLIALLLAAHDDRLRGCIVSAPVTDLTAYFGQSRLTEVSAELADMSHFAVRNSPITHVESIRCPVFLAHLPNEQRVPEVQTAAFAEKLKELSKDVVYIKDGGATEITKRCQEWVARIESGAAQLPE